MGQRESKLSALRQRDRRARKFYPLDGVDFSAVSNERLVHLYFTAPAIVDYAARVVRLSRTLVMKAGQYVTVGEAEAMRMAASYPQVRVPQIHRAFKHRVVGSTASRDMSFIVMDYIPGGTLEEGWDALDYKTRDSVASQVAVMVNAMQLKPLRDEPPGPVGGSGGAPFRGCWFSEQGAGPFATTQELEDWANEKLAVCVQARRAEADTPRFQFRELVLTHMAVAPRNLLLDPLNRVWLIDWSESGLYPRGFEHAVLASQSWNKEFADRVLSKTASQHEKERRQLSRIQYALTEAHLS